MTFILNCLNNFNVSSVFEKEPRNRMRPNLRYHSSNSSFTLLPEVWACHFLLHQMKCHHIWLFWMSPNSNDMELPARNISPTSQHCLKMDVHYFFTFLPMKIERNILNDTSLICGQKMTLGENNKIQWYKVGWPATQAWNWREEEEVQVADRDEWMPYWEPPEFFRSSSLEKVCRNEEKRDLNPIIRIPVDYHCWFRVMLLLSEKVN